MNPVEHQRLIEEALAQGNVKKACELRREFYREHGEVRDEDDDD